MVDLLEILDKKDKGFYIEAGAFDGEHMSNSLYFELKKGWNGILVEPNPGNNFKISHYFIGSKWPNGQMYFMNLDSRLFLQQKSI